jgi:hypothetical protein
VDGQSPEVFKITDSGIAYLRGLDGSVTTSPAASLGDNTTNVINIESVNHSTILQAGAGATQTVTFDMTRLPKLLETLSELKSRLAGERIDPAAKVEIGAEIEAIEVQARSSKPKATIIAATLKSLQSILESAAGSLGAEFLRRLVFPPGT